MRKITKRDVIRSVPERWHKQYADCLEQEFSYSFSERIEKSPRRETFWTILRKLISLDIEKATEEDVYKIIGNYSWTELRCDKCHKNVNSVVEVSLNNHIRVVRMCPKCAKAYSAVASPPRPKSKTVKLDPRDIFNKSDVVVIYFKNSRWRICGYTDGFRYYKAEKEDAISHIIKEKRVKRTDIRFVPMKSIEVELPDDRS